MKIKIKSEDENLWEIKVTVDDLDFAVTVDKSYWKELTGKHEKVEDLVRRSFEFLLVREPKESILKKFNLRDIEKYFPEFPEEIKTK